MSNDLDPRLPLNRPDGRPEVYEIGIAANEPGIPCWNCVLLEGRSPQYRQGEIFFCSPIDSPDGDAKPVCLKHIPANAVIYDPRTDLCRNVTGDQVWREETKS